MLISLIVVYCRGDIFNYKVELNLALFGIALAIFLQYHTGIKYSYTEQFMFIASTGLCRYPWMTPVIDTFIGYNFITLDTVADDLEDPFGLEPNALCRMIEDTLLEMVYVETPDRHITQSYMLN